MKPGDVFKQLGLALSFDRGAKGCLSWAPSGARDLMMVLIAYLHAFFSPLIGVPGETMLNAPKAADADMPLSLVMGGTSLGGWTCAPGAIRVFETTDQHDVCAAHACVCVW